MHSLSGGFGDFVERAPAHIRADGSSLLQHLELPHYRNEPDGRLRGLEVGGLQASLLHLGVGNGRHQVWRTLEIVQPMLAEGARVLYVDDIKTRCDLSILSYLSLRCDLDLFGRVDLYRVSILPSHFESFLSLQIALRRKAEAAVARQ